MTTLTASAPHTAAVTRLAQALADPTRAGVLLALRTGPATPTELSDALHVSRQVMSNHLACLRGCGLVDTASEGKRVWYRLSDAHLSAALDEILRVTLRLDGGCCTGDVCRCCA